MPFSGMSCYGSFCIYIILQRQSRRKEQTMSMTSITLICRPTKDPELRTSPSGVIFTNLDVAVTKGYGDKEHPNYFRAFCKNEMAQRVINAGVKKGSLIYITGDLDIRPYTKKDGTTGVSNEITVFDWGYVNSGKPKTDDNTQAQNDATAQSILAQPAFAPVGSIKDLYASGQQPQFEEIGEDDDLPF